MTIIQTYSKEKSKENIKFGIEITAFRLTYIYKGKEYDIYIDDLKEFHTLSLFGLK